uniref:Uncharacterized protein n=1 Tax=Pygocentrus nattereri TaxID=42514 RepID=A0A3B4BSH1_PYGNA
MSTRDHAQITQELRSEDGAPSSKWPSTILQDHHITGESHTEHKITETQIITEEKKSTSHLSSLGQLTKRSSDYTSLHEDHGPSTRGQEPTVISTRNHDEDTTGLRPEDSVLSSKMHSQITQDQQITGMSHTENKTTEVQITVGESESPSDFSSSASSKGHTKRSLDYSQNSQTTSTPTEQTTLMSQTNITTGDQHQTSHIFKSTNKTGVTDNQLQEISRSTVKIFNLETNHTNFQTSEVITYEPRKVSAVPQTNMTTKWSKQTQGTEGTKASPKKQNKNNAGPIVAALIGSVLVLMLIAIVVILAKRHRMHKKKLENPDWAGPSPFLEGDTQHGNGEDGPFQRRDTKRISLHSFFPQRLSQRLSLLVEEEVQMNEIAVSSTFGKNEQPQNGKPAEEQEQIQTQKTANQVPAPEASADSTVTEMVTGPAVPDNNANIKPTSKPDDETIPSPSSQTNTVPPRPYEDVDLNPPQTNAVDTPPAPPLP